MPVSASQFRLNQRTRPTNAEAALWAELKNRQLGGYKFTRQMTIGKFTADFVCRIRKLIVEVDGPEHEGSEHDVARTRWLNEQGYSVLRFWNEQIMLNRLSVTTTILSALEGEQTELDGANYSPALPPERVRI